MRRLRTCQTQRGSATLERLVLRVVARVPGVLEGIWSVETGLSTFLAAGLCPRTLIKVISEPGISPAAAPPRCRQVFYRRSDIVSS